MTDKKENKKDVLERVYNVPLRKEYQKAPNWKRTKKAVTALRDFMKKHMKSENVKLGKEVNDELWKHGIKNPPHHIKVNAIKNEEGEVRVELFGAKKKEEKKLKENKVVKKEETKIETTTENKAPIEKRTSSIENKKKEIKK